MIFTQYSLLSQIVLLAALGFALIALLALLNCLWRAHKMLATFIQFSIVSVVVFIIKKVFGVFGFNETGWWLAISQYFDLAYIFFFMAAAIEMFRIIRRLDGEVPKGKNK